MSRVTGVSVGDKVGVDEASGKRDLVGETEGAELGETEGEAEGKVVESVGVVDGLHVEYIVVGPIVGELVLSELFGVLAACRRAGCSLMVQRWLPQYCAFVHAEAAPLPCEYTHGANDAAGAS